jgi:hypothetical protein
VQISHFGVLDPKLQCSLRQILAKVDCVFEQRAGALLPGAVSSCEVITATPGAMATNIPQESLSALFAHLDVGITMQLGYHVSADAAAPM